MKPKPTTNRLESPQDKIHNQELRLQELLETLVGLKREQINRKHRWRDEEDIFLRRPRILKEGIETLENEIAWTRYALDELPPLPKRKRRNCALRVVE